jgi:hypothetical protein
MERNSRPRHRKTQEWDVEFAVRRTEIRPAKDEPKRKWGRLVKTVLSVELTDSVTVRNVSPSLDRKIRNAVFIPCRLAGFGVSCNVVITPTSRNLVITKLPQAEYDAKILAEKNKTGQAPKPIPGEDF